MTNLIPLKNRKYIIFIHGKNGEGLSNLDCNIILYHKWLKNNQKNINRYLTTDKNGRIYLPSLDYNYYQIFIKCPSLNNLKNEWLLDNGLKYYDIPNMIQLKENSNISIPYSYDDNNSINNNDNDDIPNIKLFDKMFMS